MKILIKYLTPWLVLVSFLTFTLSVQAETTVSKAQLPYEILDIKIEGDQLHISGWGFIAYQQHFDSYLDHGIDIEFVSATHSFRVSAFASGISQTAMMEYFGSPTCSDSSIGQVAETCNYRYNNVGFDAYIPLSSFNTGTNYQTNLISHAYRASKSYKTPLYFPLKYDLYLETPGKAFRIISRLDDTSLTVSATTVLARKEPYKSAPTWSFGYNCSSYYLNKAYFLINTKYNNVFEKVISDNTSFYRLSANSFVCYEYRRRIVEGTAYSPVWIASPYVLYSGSPLQIQVVKLNQSPKLILENTSIYEGSSFNYRQFVSAYDEEDGDLSNSIILLGTNFKSEIGDYYYDLRVCDSQNACTSGRLWVKVKEIPNNLPNITANNLRILQFSNFNPYDHASAHDIEDGDLTSSILVLNEINTFELGIFNLCYQVFDSKNAKAQTCIDVEVVDYSVFINDFRFISKNYLFYLEDIPNIWKNRMQELQDLLNNTTIIYKETFY